MSNRVYCSYFDHRYLAKGLAMIRSLRRHVPEAQVWVLCLSPEARQILDSLAEHGVHTITLADLEKGDEGLAAARADGRSTIEYYFTLTPSLVRYVMDRTAAETVTYLDGDLWFLADPEPVYLEMGASSVVIIPHRFVPEMKHLEQHGIYNVGWVSFRTDARGRACAEWWRERTNEWCFDRVDNGRFADQGYLDQFPRLFEGVHVLINQGANLAPWNVAASKISLRDGCLWADTDQVLFFHFHALRRLPSGEYLAPHGFFKAPLTDCMRDHLYKPYLRELSVIECEIIAHSGSLDRSTIREPHKSRRNWASRLKDAIQMVSNRRRGYVIAPD